jgi:site-specific recombinase XerD
MFEGKTCSHSRAFTNTIATDMIEQGIDMYTVKEFLGDIRLSMTEKYVKVYLTSLKAKYDA